MVKDSTFTYGVGNSRWMVVRLDSQVVINQPYYFQPDNDISGKQVTGIDLIDQDIPASLFAFGNLSGEANGFNLIAAQDNSLVMVSLANSKQEYSINQMPAKLFRNQPGNGAYRYGKKNRVKIEVEPESSFVTFSEILPFTTFPAVFVLNLILKD